MTIKWTKLIEKFVADCGDGVAVSLLAQGRRHLNACRCIVAASTRVELERVVALFMEQAVAWRTYIEARTDANDAQLSVQRAFEDNALHVNAGPLDTLMMEALVAIGVTDRVRRATRQFLKLMLWEAVGAATRDRRVNHDSTKRTFDDTDCTSAVVFSDTDEMSLYYIAGFAGRCATVAYPTINTAALASSSSHEYHVLTSIYGNEALLRGAPLAHKIVTTCVRFVRACVRACANRAM